jgi:ABC-type branched-subunit amino acid transport system ATPase component
VLVLEQGRLLAEGAPKTIRTDARVLDAYLGRERQAERDPAGLQ